MVIEAMENLGTAVRAVAKDGRKQACMGNNSGMNKTQRTGFAHYRMRTPMKLLVLQVPLLWIRI